MDEKIYSRRRFILKPCSFKRSFRVDKNKKKKLITLVLSVVLIILVIEAILGRIEPIFEGMCEEKVKAIATIITNKQSTQIMNKYQYEELFTIEKDQNGNIVIIKSNVVPMNNMISDLTGNVQTEFDKIEKTRIKIPIGSLTGGYIFSGVGPRICIDATIVGNVDTEVKSEFIQQGINQTLHRVYLVMDCEMRILTPLKKFEKNIVNQVIIAEHVIIGNIPDSYYNLEGMESRLDAMEVIN